MGDAEARREGRRAGRARLVTAGRAILLVSRLLERLHNGKETLHGRKDVASLFPSADRRLHTT